MHAFLFAHVHWLWSILHLVHDLIFDWKTFWVVLALGVGQTLIAWDGGILAVKGVEDKFSPTVRRWHRRFFTTLAIGLLLMTAAIGYLNDQNQHQADVKTQEAVRREERLQATLDQQYPLLLQATIALAATKQTVVTGGPSNKVLGQIDEIQRTLARAIAERASIPAPAAAVVKDPLSQLSNSELKSAVLTFCGRLRSDDSQMYDLADGIIRVRPSSSIEQTAQQTTLLNERMDTIIQQDIPQANQYRAELLRRIGARAGVISEFPPVRSDVTTLNRFLTISSLQLYDLAHELRSSD